MNDTPEPMNDTPEPWLTGYRASADPVGAALIGSVDAALSLFAQPSPHDPPNRRHGIAHLRDRLAWHTDTVLALRKRIDHYVAEAERLEAECDQIGDIIDELRDDIGMLGGTP